MTDTHAAIYDAVRSRMSSANTGDAILQAAREAFDISYMKAIAAEQFGVAIENVADELKRPSVLFRPELRPTPDGRRWAAFHQGHAFGFGNSPDEAMRSFDTQWTAKVGP